jgi:hypothetical protein
MLKSQEPASGAFRVPTNAPVVSKLAREFEKKFASARAIGSPLGIPVAFAPRSKIRGQILANPAQGIVKFPGGIPIFRTWECFILHDIKQAFALLSCVLRLSTSAAPYRPTSVCSFHGLPLQGVRLYYELEASLLVRVSTGGIRSIFHWLRSKSD